SNGGSAVAPIAQDYNTLVSKPTDPTKTGYTFEAWYKDSNLTTAFNFAKDKLTENTMLYAKWTANQYTLAFNSNGGSAVAPIAQDYNTLVSKPTDPTKGENVFGGWYKDINFATAFNFAKDKLTENTTLYAKWITVASADLFDFTFTDNTNTAYSIKKKANVTLPNEIALPSSYNGVHVTSIGERAFKGCSGLTEVTIPDSVTSIGMLAFNECSGLTSITIPNSVTSIGKNAFDGCSGLTSITIPTSVTSIGNYAFCYCRKLTTITIPNSVTSIGEGAFSGCSGLTSITIGSGVKSIGQGAFSFCWKLTSITVDKGNTTYHSAGNCIIETAKDTLVLGCNNSIIPTDGSVTSIGEYAFDGCSGLTSITIPTSVTSIGAHAFYDCSNLKSITIPNSVTSIGGWAFLGCNGLTSVIIPSSVTSIGSQAFSGCSGLTSITIPNSVTSIGRYVFENCTKLATINCKAASQPSGWEERWNELCNATVVWGYTGA
ncbi:MAG: leucine-rich repeat protein, partial [Clostridia bacterium]